MSCTTGLALVLDTEELDDQIMVSPPLTIKRVPCLSNLTVPKVLLTGFIGLATHAIVRGDVSLYHIPRYRLLELPGLKKPSSNCSFPETIVSPSEIF
uniref:Uncharacterized protein n=1 Tax=Tanacetum cinerariifolium TaxID=118510 RepID=A0A699SZI6_TANCI|nr:hypothetical protein [Tanacetum cinerariifolium]